MSSGRAVLKKDRLEEERELLRRLLEKEGLSAPSAETAGITTQEQPSPSSPEVSEEIPSLFPLSCQQEQLWFLDRFLPSSDFYNVALAWRLKGDLDVPRLERSLQEVVRRHEILRTCFVMSEDEEPRQKVVGKGLEVRFLVMDLRKLEAGEREKQAKAVVAEEGGKVFDLSRAPLLRGVLLRTGEREHVLGLTLHHIICDEWSLGVLMEELGKLYEAYGRGEESPLPELEMQYREYALEQRERLRGGKFQEQMEYWKRQLEGMPQVLELPTDHARHAQQSFRGGILQHGLESDLLEGLNALGRAEGASLFMTLLAAFQVLLMRYSGQEDFGVGTSITNRSRTNTHGLIGFFLNTLVMRANLRGEPSFREALRQVRQIALGGYEHQDLPFEKLVEELAPDRDLSRNPVIQVMFTVRRPTQSKFGPFELGEFGGEIQTSKFDLSMIVEDSRQPTIAFNYSTHLFTAETIERMLGHYEQLLTAIVKNPEQRVWDLPLLTDPERDQLEKWNQTGRDYDRDKNIAELFEECAARMPNAVAVECEGKELTYGELNRRGNRLAHYLRELGVQAEQRVAICVERGLEMVVGLMAILKAGGAYVPMDPEYPQEHLRYMLQDSAPVVLLTQEHLRGILGGIEEKVAVVDVNDSGRFSHQPESNLPSVGAGLEAGHLAYLIYTSGSTGTPKGVMVSHRNLLSATFARKLAYGELGRFLLLSSISFDSSVAGIFGSLIYGGTLIIAPRDVVRDPLLLNQQVQRLGVESLLCVPSLYRHFLEYPIRNEPKKLSRVIVAGEVCPLDLVAKSAEKEPQVELFNEYGPTEGTVWATVHRCVHPVGEQSVPIGGPIANARIHILDAKGESVPIGVVGELHIGGAGVARGYWNRPELTAEKFVPDPLAGDVKARMYKTGDLGRWRPDGTIEFIGRNDSQVKIRGYRVELEEIERVLREQVAVKEAVVSAREDQAGGKQLVAYVVEKSQEKRLPEEEEDFSVESKRVGEFTRLYDDLYGRDEAYAYADQGVNLRIWSSSYTNQPLAEEEIAESVTQTVKSIRELGGRRVLEIGCGTGLLLSRIAPHCDAYCGLDVSAEALRRLRAQLGEKPEFSHVTLREGAANQSEGLDAERFDCVVLNEVAQHFPDMDYLLKVLKKAAELVEPRGTIFLGGMRNLHLLEAFHGSVQMFQARDSMRLDELRRRIQQQMRWEKDLIVAPEFFTGVKAFLPQVTAAQVQLKRGQYRNEITCFKYDVTLYVGYEQVDPVDRQEMEWAAEKWSVRELEQWVREQSPDVARIKRIANARLAKEKGLLELLGRKDGKASVAEIRQASDQWVEKEGGIDPEDFLSLEHSVPYQVEISWAGGGHDGAYDVILTKRSLLSGDFVAVEHGRREDGRGGEAWTAAAEFANHPMAEGRFSGQLSRELVEELRRGLKQKLPEHMIPSVFMKLESLPLTANGKVDRQALPEVGELELGAGGEDYEAPRAGVEEQLAQIWGAVLRVTRVGRRDNFFRSGGHSLLATSMASRFRNVFGIDVPVRAIFESPTVAELAEWIERDLKLQGGTSVKPSLYPLSYQQEQLWFLDRFNPGTAFYNVPLTLRLKGDLDAPRLVRSLQEMVRRHEILRTCFVMGEDQEPKQKVAGEKLDVRLPVVDLRKLEAGEREEQAKKVLAEEESKAFDLSRAPLFRGVVVRIEEGDHILGLTLHHIICDEWSLGVLMEELEELYEAYGRGEESPLPELGMQYGKYALEQRERLRGEKFQKQMEYWKKQLEGMPQVLELPTDHMRPAQQSFRGGMQELNLESRLLEGLNALGRGEGASLFMTSLAAFQVLLMRYTGQQDFGVGISITNRSRTNTQGLIGFFVNTLVIRANLRGEPAFREVLRQARQTALSAYEHQELPFEKLVEELTPDRDLSRGPLVQVMFSVPRLTGSNFGSFELSEFEADIRTSKFDFAMYVEESSEPKIAINYSTDLFEAETIDRLLGHYERLLKGIVENPEQQVWRLPFLTGPEIKQLETWNQTVTGYEREKTVTELFEECAARMPNNVAVEYEGRELTYGELNRRANQLGRYLRTIGVKPETRVAIGVERGLEMVVGMVAVLKAGGAYVPLDLSYPEQRLQFILQDSAPVALLARSDLRDLPGGIEAGIQIVDVENEIACADLPETNLERVETGVDPECLAYVIYTSGSTGEPKGSEIPHRSIPGFIFGTDYVCFNEETVLLQHSSVSWDPLTLELWGALLTGGRSVLARQQRVTTGEEIREYVQGRGVNTLWLTAALFNSIVESDVKCLEGLKYLMTGGETASVTHIRRALEELPRMRMVNGYGPSECTVFSSCYVVPTDLPETLISLPIGKPIGDRRMYVLDPWMNVAPVGVVGEGFIGGASVARGYMGRPDVTAERFVPDPCGGEAGGRLYRTGDLVRWLKNGTIEFVGRNDYQVKVRGFRIELGEIEAMLQQQSGVQGCAVVVKIGVNGSKRLVAYVVGVRNHEELRRSLKGKLPSYMIPNAIVGLQELPLTSNGKLDRQVLEKLEDLDSGDSGEDYEAPRTAVEEQLAGIWAAVLEVMRVGRLSNFFDLGGHSLLAVSMASRCRNVFGLDVPIQAIFESPTIAELAEVIELRLKSPGKKPGDNKDVIAMQRSSAPRSSIFPLSYQQEQLWFLDRFEPSSDFYNVPLAWSLKGDLDVPRLERSLQEVMWRHEILRTCFVMGEDEEPKQKVVGKGFEVRLPVLDLRNLEEGEREEQARKVLAKEGSKAFDLSRTPLLRAMLVRTEEREHVLGLTLHHIICDDWSLGVLLSELGKLYEAYGRGEESPLPKLGMQYGEYALEQREGLREGRFQQQMEYWKGRLKGMPQVLELPTDLGRPVRQSFRGSAEQRVLRGDLVDALNAVGRDEKASLFMILLAVLQVLLMRYTGQEDFGIGTPVANRKRIETEPMIGFFLNTLVIRAILDGEPTFREVLRRVRDAALAAYDHQDVSFEKLVEELAPDRDVSRTPIFQVLFTTLGAAEKLEFGDLEVGGFAVDFEMSKFDLTIGVQEAAHGAAITINYATDLFEAETIRRMLGHYERLLKAVVENPVQRVWRLPLLTEPEIKQLETWNQTARDYARGKTIAGLFEENAARIPNAIAVEYEQQELKYGDLNREANRLAHYLRVLGVKPDTLVAVCVDRSLEMVVGLLAVMKAGGAFVPLDPAYPEERLRFMLEDSRPAVLLTQGHLRGLFTEIREGLSLIDLGSTEAWSDQPDSNPEHASIGVTATDLAYVIYTSGSTGMPKGVAMPLGAATNMIAWQMNESIWAGPQRTLQFAALGFDVSFQEIFSTLCAGGTLVLIDEEKRRNSTDLTRYVMEKGIQRLFLPYVGLRMLAEGVAQMGAALKKGESFHCALQEINVAGEQLRIDDKIRGLFKRLEHCRLNNHYGPTETHAASAFHLNSEKEHWPLLPPIGQPIAHAQIYILDKHEQLVPLGVTGELYIGGAGVARGYFNRPELTEKRFLNDRFAKKDGARVYRSGDLGRWRPDGTIEFIGRNDSQVKIRGYRVEVGEIEAMLQQQSGVRGCAVVAKTGANGSKRLAAYVVGERKSEELRRDLKGKLPAYMVPSVIVALPELPLSGNGKVDREALEKLEDLGLEAGHYEAPRTAIEEQLAEIWAETLEVTRVGRDDNFFDLGGHSLLATLLATRMENTFEIGVPVRAIFESPTIAELADVIELGLKVQGRKLAEGGKGVARAPIASATRPSLFPLSFQQEQLWFLDRFNPGNAFYNIPMTWRLKGDLDVSRLERSLQEVVRRHEILRTCFVMSEDEEPRQKVVGERLDVPLPVMDLRMLERGQREEQAKKVLMEEAGKAFDLGHAPLLRGVLVRTEDIEHILGLTLHHIICDDWSLGVLMEELGKLYGAYERGEESPLPELAMQYGEYALEQREGLHGGRFQQQMEYWKGQLKGMPQVLELPTDHVRPARESFRGGTEQRILHSDLLDALNMLGREEKASLLMILLAAFQVLLMRYSGQDDFGVGTVVANRKRNETKGLIGFFLNTLVIRANLGGQPAFRDVLRQVREAVLDGYEHQDLAFEKLVEELAPDRDVSRSPVFQVAFTLRRAIPGKSDFGGLELVPFGLDPGTSKFDLILGVEEARQSATVGLNYTTDLFEAKSIRHMLEHYERLLEGIVADVDQPVWALPMMSKLDEKVLSNLNGTGLVSRTEKNIIEIFDAQAECMPQESAVISGETQLSYAELDRRANQVAHYLARMGVAPESLVGIFMPDSQDMIVALLGVLKAGGAYLLLDVLNPKDRLKSIIGSSDTAILLTLEGLRKRLPQTNARVVCLDSEWEVIGQQSTTNPEVQINPQGLACVVYTAVSEEHAKGLMIEHNGLMDLVSAREVAGPAAQNGHARENRFGEVWPRLTSSSFLAGASAFLTLVAEGQRATFRPSGNAEIYILDPHLQRVAIDVPGELWIAGPAAGRAYLGRPSLTAEKFRPNPFKSEMGARMYGSGERARYREDGTVELLGRLDDRTEIEGFPVELGEIEAALANYESVEKAVVVVRPNGELVAYAVVRDGKRLGQNELRSYLDSRLPPYMIPSTFITLQELPQNARGKVDRAALSILGQEQLTGEFVPPRTELEQTIASAWQAILGVDQVGVHDNFFDLGGHSLLMIQLHQKLRVELSVQLELLHLFQFPTIDALVRFLHTGYNFDGKSRETRERAGRQKGAIQKLKRMHTP